MSKILFAGASGFGNIGDDSYKTILSENLPEHECLFDSPYPDTRAVDWCDMVVIGGGGLIYNNQTQHFEYMRTYLDTALAQGKPFAFLSCGVQPKELDGNFVDREQAASQIACWKPYLDNAKFVSVRSEACVEILSAVTVNKNLFYYPDLAYISQPAKSLLTLPKSYLVIPTPSGAKTKEFEAKWAEFVRSHKPVYVLAFSRDDEMVVDRLAHSVDNRGNLMTRKRFTPAEAVAMLSTAEQVLTSRYHGFVLGRAAGLSVDQITVADRRYKSRVEDEKLDPQKAINHIELLKKTLSNLLL